MPAVITPLLAVAPHVVLLALFERRMPPCSSCSVSVAFWKLTSTVKPPPMRRRPTVLSPEASVTLDAATPKMLAMFPDARIPDVSGVLLAPICWVT